jgi:hypothetical protein
MIVINYPRHFSYLALALVIEFTALWSIDHWLHRPVFLDSLDTHFVLNGLLHGTALILALTVRASRSRRVVFVAIATVLSFAVGFAAVNIKFIGLAIPSAIGAAAYWYLVRLLWIHELTVTSLLRTVVLCAAVTVAWDTLILFMYPSLLQLMLHTLCWWLAFSFSLYVSERRGSSWASRVTTMWP